MLDSSLHGNRYRWWMDWRIKENSRNTCLPRIFSQQLQPPKMDLLRSSCRSTNDQNRIHWIRKAKAQNHQCYRDNLTRTWTIHIFQISWMLAHPEIRPWRTVQLLDWNQYIRTCPITLHSSCNKTLQFTSQGGRRIRKRMNEWSI